MATILIVEDDPNTQLLIAENLKSYFEILCANNGKEALQVIYKKKVDLIIADIMMPRMDGYQFVKTLREEKNLTPVLMLTAKQTIDDKREGFLSGTDDYMTKPVNYEELLMRIKALLRRAKISTDRKIEIGAFTLDTSNFSAMYKGNIIELKRKEFDLLFKLLSYPSRIFTQSQLLDDVWGQYTESGEETIKTHISKLRKLFEDCTEFEIVNLRGLGYKAEIKEGGAK